MLTELFQNLQQFHSQKSDNLVDFSEPLALLVQSENDYLLVSFQEVLDFAKAPKIGTKITQKGGRTITCDPSKTYPCGNVCRSHNKGCKSPVEGQASTYAGWLELQAKMSGKLTPGKDEPSKVESSSNSTAKKPPVARTPKPVVANDEKTDKILSKSKLTKSDFSYLRQTNPDFNAKFGDWLEKSSSTPAKTKALKEKYGDKASAVDIFIKEHSMSDIRKIIRPEPEVPKTATPRPKEKTETQLKAEAKAVDTLYQKGLKSGETPIKITDLVPGDRVVHYYKGADGKPVRSLYEYDGDYRVREINKDGSKSARFYIGDGKDNEGKLVKPVGEEARKSEVKPATEGDTKTTKTPKKESVSNTPKTEKPRLETLYRDAIGILASGIKLGDPVESTPKAKTTTPKPSLETYGRKGKITELNKDNETQELDDFLNTPSKNHQVIYIGKDGSGFNAKQVIRSKDLGYITGDKTKLLKKDKDAQFKQGLQGLDTNQELGTTAYIKTPDGKFYEVSDKSRVVKPITADEIRKRGLSGKPVADEESKVETPKTSSDLVTKQGKPIFTKPKEVEPWDDVSASSPNGDGERFSAARAISNIGKGITGDAEKIYNWSAKHGVDIEQLVVQHGGELTQKAVTKGSKLSKALIEAIDKNAPLKYDPAKDSAKTKSKDFDDILDHALLAKHLATKENEQFTGDLTGAVERIDRLRSAVNRKDSEGIAKLLPEAIIKLNSDPNRKKNESQLSEQLSDATMQYALEQYKKLTPAQKKAWANDDTYGFNRSGVRSKNAYDTFAGKGKIHKEIADDLKKYYDGDQNFSEFTWTRENIEHYKALTERQKLGV